MSNNLKNILFRISIFTMITLKHFYLKFPILTSLCWDSTYRWVFLNVLSLLFALRVIRLSQRISEIKPIGMCRFYSLSCKNYLNNEFQNSLYTNEPLNVQWDTILWKNPIQSCSFLIKIAFILSLSQFSSFCRFY